MVPNPINPFHSPTPTHIHTLYNPDYPLLWTDDLSLATTAAAPYACGPLVIDFWLLDGLGTKVSLVSAMPTTLFTVDLIARSFTALLTTDLLSVGTYELAYEVGLVNYAAVPKVLSTSWFIDIVNPCDPPLSLVPPPSFPTLMEYTLGQTALVFSIAPFVVDPAACQPFITYSLTTSSADLDLATTFVGLTRTVTLQEPSNMAITTALAPFYVDHTVTVTGSITGVISGVTSSAPTYQQRVWNPCKDPIVPVTTIPFTDQVY